MVADALLYCKDDDEAGVGIEVAGNVSSSMKNELVSGEELLVG